MAKEIIAEGVSKKVFPGASYAIQQGDEPAEIGSFGRLSYGPNSPAVTPDTWYDLASLTKVIVTTTLTMRLVERGRINLDQSVHHFIPTFGHRQITLHDLLSHQSGLPAFRPYHLSYQSAEEVDAAIDAEPLAADWRTEFIYSDLNMRLLQRVLEAVEEESLDALWDRLNLPGLRFSPSDSAGVAPTEPVEHWRKIGAKHRFREANVDYVCGQVHDPMAATVGGVAGHAGLFGTVHGVLEFARALTQGKLVSEATVRQFRTPVSTRSSRALGWDTKSPSGSSAGQFLSRESFGHTGFTGTSLWIDPVRAAVYVLLTNRVHPTATNRKILEFRPRFHDAVAKF